MASIPSPKIADSLVQMAARVLAAGGAGRASLSNSLVHVRADGAIEVVLHSLVPIGAGQRADLARLGVDVGLVSGLPAPMVEAWAPPGQLEALAALGWVAAITPPAYPSGGG